MSEEWRKIEGYKAYEVSNMGRVRSYWDRHGMGGRIMDTPQRILTGNTGGKYKAVGLSQKTRGWRKQHLVHRLVLEAFVGPRPAGLEICHYDDDGHNNRLENLRYDTPLANAADAKRNRAAVIPNSTSAVEL